jgi:hypothetical protein
MRGAMPVRAVGVHAVRSLVDPVVHPSIDRTNTTDDTGHRPFSRRGIDRHQSAFVAGSHSHYRRASLPPQSARAGWWW